MVGERLDAELVRDALASFAAGIDDAHQLYLLDRFQQPGVDAAQMSGAYNGQS